MLAIHFLFSLLLAAFAAAQQTTNNATGIHGIPKGLGDVDTTTRNQWCLSQKNTCKLLCGGSQYAAKNDCDGTTLSWNCTCANGKEPDNLDQYINTLPQKECDQVFKVCNQANPGAASCKETKCGSLDPSSVKAGAGAASTSSAAASSTAASTATVTTAPSATKATGAGVKFMPEIGFAVGVVAAMGALL
ncbi:hypothetical protein G7Y79_00002g004770 [Physcia stellaris]|nr:hypothetical protein G7Y79_00002g004770 [Physcia stellaris]